MKPYLLNSFRKKHLFSIGTMICWMLLIHGDGYSQVNQQKILEYDEYGNPIEVQDANGIRSAYKWSANGTLLTGVFKNAEASEIQAISMNKFSSNSYGLLAHNLYIYKNGDGTLTYAKGNEDGIPHQKVEINGLSFKSDGLRVSVGSQPTGKEFIVDFEYKVESGRLDLHGKNSSTNVWTDWFSATTTDGWERASVTLTINTNGDLYFRAPWHADGGTYPNTIFYLRHIRIYPAQATAISASYDELFSQPVSIYDEAIGAQYFSYDDFGRLEEVRNHAGQLVEDYQYEIGFSGSNYSHSNSNYIRTRSYTGDQTMTSYEFFDGLGRLIQTQQSSGGSDAIVQHTFYDEMGREEVVTNPIETSTNLNYLSVSNLMGSGWEPGDAISTTGAAQFSYFDTQVGSSDAQYSYSQTAYEASPLDRVIKQAAPGDTYKLSDSRTVDFEYGLNTPSNENFSGDNGLGYAEDTLLRQTVTDENGINTWEFTDGWGQTIAKVNDLDGDNTVSSSDIITGFEYDLLGNLKKVHEPKGWGSSNYKREYDYDELGRLTNENTPDLEASTEYKYDKAGNLRFVRNAEHKKSPTCSSFAYQTSGQGTLGTFDCNKSGIIEYDLNIQVQGEVVLQFDLQKDDNPWTTIYRGTYDAWDLYYGVSEKTLIADGSYQIDLEETYNYYGQWGGSVSGDFKPFTFQYNKYDELGRIIETGEYYGSSSSFSDLNAESASFPTSSKQAFVKYYYDDNGYSGAQNLKGRLARAEYLDLNTWQWGDTWYSYDEDGRVEWIRQDLPGFNLSTKLIEYSYNRQGQITEVKYQPNSTSDRLNVWYDYNAAGQLYQVWTSRANRKSGAKLEATYTYNADGQVSNQSLGGDLSEGAQLIENEYHVRGWLSQINDPDDLSASIGNFPDSRFALDLNYETCSDNCSEDDNWEDQYNGNISQARWTVSPPNAIANDSPIYNYSYDEANQLTMADYHNPNAGTYNYDVRSISYDKSGNFEELTRYRNSSTDDDFDYRYYSGTNRLMNVEGSSTAQDYTYDRIGNMVSNQDRDITSIAYNGSNLPTRLLQKVNNSSSANLHEYSYDSEGNRVRKRFNRTFSNATSYIRGADGQVIAVYQGSTLQFWNLPGGIGRVTK